MAKIETTISYMNEKLDANTLLTRSVLDKIDSLDRKFASKTVEYIVYGMIATICLGVLGVWIKMSLLG